MAMKKASECGPRVEEDEALKVPPHTIGPQLGVAKVFLPCRKSFCHVEMGGPGRGGQELSGREERDSGTSAGWH